MKWVVTGAMLIQWINCCILLQNTTCIKITPVCDNFGRHPKQLSWSSVLNAGMPHNFHNVALFVFNSVCIFHVVAFSSRMLHVFVTFFHLFFSGLAHFFWFLTLAFSSPLDHFILTYTATRSLVSLYTRGRKWKGPHLMFLLFFSLDYFFS